MPIVTDNFADNFGALAGRSDGIFNWSKILDLSLGLANAIVSASDGGRVEMPGPWTGVFGPGIADMASWDYTVTISARANNPTDPGVTFVGTWLRYGNLGADGYHCLVVTSGPTVILEIRRYTAGIYAVIAQQLAWPTDFRNAYHEIQTAAIGNLLTVKIDGVLALSVVDNTYPTGGPGLYLNSQISTYTPLVDYFTLDYEAAPIIQVDSPIEVTADEGTAAAPVNSNIVNIGDGTLVPAVENITYIDGSGWLTVDLLGLVLTITCDATLLEDGIYQATFDVTDPEASNSPQTVTVVFTVNAVIPPDPPDLGCFPTDYVCASDLVGDTTEVPDRPTPVMTDDCIPELSGG